MNVIPNLRSLFGIEDSAPAASSSLTEAPLSTGDSITKGKQITWKQWGFKNAGRTGASQYAFSAGLTASFNQLVSEQKDNHELQAKHIQDLKEQKEAAIAEKEAKVLEKSDLSRAIDRLKEKIKEWKDAIEDIRNGKSNPTDRISYYIALSITVLLGLYLFLFYSSAAYSAFFFEFNAKDNLSMQAAIFNGQAIPQSFGEGLFKGLFVTLLPVIFLALGFLLHVKLRRKQYIVVAALYLVTFIFDCILAFEISRKMYEIKGMASLETVPEYTLQMAIREADFWIIIMCGFIAYVIWGLMFDEVMNYIDNLKNGTAEIHKLKNSIDDADDEIEAKKRQMSQCDIDCERLTAKIKSLEERINRNFVIDYNLIKIGLADFHQGWLSYMAGYGSEANAQSEISETYKHFISQNISNYND